MKSFTSTLLLLVSAAALISAESTQQMPPPPGFTKDQHYDLVYGKYALIRSVSLSGAPKGCYPALAATLTKAVHSGRIGYIRTRTSTPCHPTDSNSTTPEPVWYTWNTNSATPEAFPPEIARSMNIFLLDAYAHQDQKHVLYNVFYEDRPVGTFGYKVGGVLPLQYYDLEANPGKVVKDSRWLNAMVGFPDMVTLRDWKLGKDMNGDGSGKPSKGESVLTCYRINVDTGRAANVTINPLVPVKNPKYIVGNRESAYSFPNVKGYEAIMVGWGKEEGDKMANSQFVRGLVASMAENRFSNVEYQCGNMFVEVTALAYETLR
ncbi:hypothetical protein EC991_008866 [Linnemannia zychae]|nr:hypothetical protein EC991_008866 [Linnemannia zychae]